MVENKEETKGNRTGLSLYFLLCVIILALTILTIGAYCDYKTSKLKREGLLVIIGQQMLDTKDNKDSADTEKLKQLRTILNGFRVIAEGMAQDDNMSFLFTVFSIALVSGGAYLLERSRQNVRLVEGKVDRLKKDTEEIQMETIDTRKTAKKVDMYLEKKQITDNISEGFLKAEDISNELQQEENINVFLCLLSDERQELDRIYRYLKDIKYIDETQIEKYKRKTFGIKAKLQSVIPQFQQKVKELVTKCDKIMKFCKSLRIRS